MPRLSQTIAHLAAVAARTRDGDGHAPAPHLDELTGFGSNPGNLRGWVHAPATRGRGAAMVVALHGCTQSASGYDRGTGWSALADRHGFVVLLPEQQRANNPNTCFNWFLAEDTARGSGEALSIRQMIAAAIATHDVDPSRVFITGLSAGGAMTSAMLAAYPELFAGGAIIAGLAHGTATGAPEAFERMRGRGAPSGAALGGLVRSASTHAGPWPIVSIWHGTADPTVNPTNATMIADQWREVHGLGDADPVDTVAGYPHTVWRDAAGRAVLERYEITGMKHGTPLATAGEDGLGVAGPFMLEAAISSTHHIARFWGLIDAEARAAPAPMRTAPSRPAQPVATQTHNNPPHDGPPHNDPPRTAPAVPWAGPARVIDDALRAAGLVR